MGIGAALIGAGALGAGASIYAGSQAASAQKKAATQATNVQQDMFNTTQNNLRPYIDAGTSDNNTLLSYLNADAGGGPGGGPGFLTPFNPTQAQLEATPGYQFTRDQGLKAVNNSNSAVGWGLSGAGLKGIASYASGLADQTYQQQFGNYWTQQGNMYNMLYGPAQLGENAAAGQGQIGATTGANIGNNITGAANASAAATTAAGAQVANLPNFMLEYSMLNNTAMGGTNALNYLSPVSGNSFAPGSAAGLMPAGSIFS